MATECKECGKTLTENDFAKVNLCGVCFTKIIAPDWDKYGENDEDEDGLGYI